jgi:DNA-binding NarL/FixJ family response regulator
MEASRIDPSESTTSRGNEFHRAEACLRALLTWVGRRPAAADRAEVASLLDDLLGSDQDVVATALRRVALTPVSDRLLHDRFHLTARETAVARQLALGSSNAEIAKALAISEHTCRRHTEQILAKLGVRSRAGVPRVLAQAWAPASTAR